MNQSPFEPHGTSRRRPAGHSVVQGVRRWISSHPSSVIKQTNKKPVLGIETRQPPAEPELPERYSTEAVAKQLLNPVVSEKEELEYQEYIDQCQALLNAPFDSGERKALEIYTKAVQTAAGETSDWVEEKDLITYVEHGNVHYVESGGRRGEPFPVTYPYERWLMSATTG
ncbi:hypothetical protein K435DRAFT_436 [Dendrothele bispora CBS 962.96]|uniref:Uncharacterized protein n=1 Tax=Dendrothele bispora (strain CBS 962.96) TaxID=1314807 RepID=A0A4S8MXK0_DENBC|nr:hypothetical protein K435DRAFT_436 [Dendrothele bispora CBS 962.96]